MSPFEQLLRQFQRETSNTGEINLPYALTFDNNLQVTCSENGTSALLTGVVIKLHETAENDHLLRSLMQLYLVKMYEQQEVLCLDQSSATIELFRRFKPAETDLESFRQYLENFVNELEFWQNNAQMLNQQNNRLQQGNYSFLVP